MISRQKQMLLLLSASFLAQVSGSTRLIGSHFGRLPSSLSQVVNAYDEDSGDEVESIGAACLLSSKSVTQLQKQNLLETLVEGYSKEGDYPPSVLQSKAFALLCKEEGSGEQKGLALVVPPSASVYESAETACACQGQLIYYPATVDLQRGEGLFETLAPAMERILDDDQNENGSSPKTLWVVVPDGNIAKTKAQLENAAEAVLAHLITQRTTSGGDLALLQDVFDQVHYVSPQEVVSSVIASTPTATLMDFRQRLSEMASSFSAYSKPIQDTVGDNLAAARKLGPAARTVLEATTAKVLAVCQVEDDSDQNSEAMDPPQFRWIPQFGKLCQEAVQQALQALGEETADSAPSLRQSVMAKRYETSLILALETDLGSLLEEQLSLTEAHAFDQFKKQLSSLIVGPNLQEDMEKMASESMQLFAKLVKPLVPRIFSSSSTWRTEPAVVSYRRRVKEYVSNRLLKAKAGNQFREAPRKGFGLGFHYLLPKPFGNDYRQEPWMVHATDDLVYIPPDKVTNVSPEDVSKGDWRSKIVPSPVGNDMIYMQ